MDPASSSADILAASYKYGSTFKTPVEHNAQMKAFLFGYPISHSLAPLLHGHLFQGVGVPWTFSLLETKDTTKFLPTLKQSDVIGCAVTMPYKVTMLSAVDELTEEARMVGAINTIFLRRAEDGKTRYIGTNTDTIGIREAFLQNYSQLPAQSSGRPALVIGGGGACRAAVYALSKWMGVSKIYMVNRIESEVRDIMGSFGSAGLNVELIFVSTIAEAAVLEAPALVVGTVPDITPREKGEILAREIVDVFLAKEEKGCEEMGWDVLFGTESMLWQGVAQESLWTELPMHQFNLDEAKEALTNAIKMHSVH
ncbi:unnamed protein product [Penicillium pancosmium]